MLSGRFDCYKLVWITPLFFGFGEQTFLELKCGYLVLNVLINLLFVSAHVHHVRDHVREGMPLSKALVIACKLANPCHYK